MQRFRTFIVAALAVVASAVSFAQTQGSSAAQPGRDLPPPRPAAPAPAQPAPGLAGVTAVVTPPAGYLIGPDDVLIVLFREEKDMSGEVVVRPDGKISLPLVNDIQAAGLTPDQLRTSLQETATKYLQEPTVTIVVKTINSRKVYITGMVAKPGFYQLTGAMTVVQLLATAGGVQEFADSKNISIVRNEGGKQISYVFNYKDFVKRKNLKQNIELKPGDTIVVP